MNSTWPACRLALVSAVLLALELACIRWFPAHVLYLTFFTNGVMLAAFVGMSVGCLLADRPNRLIVRTPIWLAIAFAAGLLAELFSSRINRYVNVGGQSNPEVVYYGTEPYAAEKLVASLPAEWLFGVYFVLIAMAHVGLGQELGRSFNAVAHRLTAYAANLIGSLAGIGLFALASLGQLPPVVWMLAIGTGLAWLLVDAKAGRWSFVATAIAIGLTVPTSGVIALNANEQIWSPYYRIRYEPTWQGVVTNQIGHQNIQSIAEAAEEPYALPYLLRRDVPGWPEFRRVMIVGAGTGNDIARACQWLPADATIDAVEIDPAIQALGVRLHPDRPYDDVRVRRHIADGRTFLKNAPDDHYDLVIFALIDSLVLANGTSSLRLESYLYTDPSFADVRRVLKADGIFAMSNFFRRTFVTRRLVDGLTRSFDREPVLITNPPVARLFADGEDRGISVMIAGAGPAIERLREQFRFSARGKAADRLEQFLGGRVYRFPDGPVPTTTPNGFESDEGIPFRPTVIDAIPDLPPATDDWPFLYSRRPLIPGHNVTGILLMLLLSLLVYWGAERSAGRLDRVGQGRIDAGPLMRSFLLGTGFMLIETKAVVQMSLHFGSTWTVNTVVLAAILAMSLAGSVFAAVVKPKSLVPFFALLYVSLIANVVFPPSVSWSPIAACLVSFAPVAFAGVIFAVTFSRSQQPDRMFGANVAGALVGGLAENLSMLLGFRGLGLVALAVYAASAWFGSITKGESPT
jgi:SAM-dependent methyltransferase